MPPDFSSQLSEACTDWYLVADRKARHIGQVVLCIRLGEYSKIGATKVTDNLQAAAALAADGLITFGLCWRLNQGRGGIQSTNKMLNFLIMTAVNRGGCTIIFAALNIILFFSRPGTFDFMLVIFISDKFYMNSMLAMLNTRRYAVNVGGAEGMIVQHLSLPVFEANPHVMTNTVSISISTTQQTDEPYVIPFTASQRSRQLDRSNSGKLEV
ncbi:hypothetical protein DFH06DRAFT_1333806 [Mycena polygramma]|nr:hypothetical protein DFH06DRAFT_1333806 [Mycena polygramma]